MKKQLVLYIAIVFFFFIGLEVGISIRPKEKIVYTEAKYSIGDTVYWFWWGKTHWRKGEITEIRIDKEGISYSVYAPEEWTKSHRFGEAHEYEKEWRLFGEDDSAKALCEIYYKEKEEIQNKIQKLKCE
jgi:hypothetical protein